VLVIVCVQYVVVLQQLSRLIRRADDIVGHQIRGSIGRAARQNFRPPIKSRLSLQAGVRRPHTTRSTRMKRLQEARESHLPGNISTLSDTASPTIDLIRAHTANYI
jgi:hypothetical protein